MCSCSDVPLVNPNRLLDSVEHEIVNMRYSPFLQHGDFGNRVQVLGVKSNIQAFTNLKTAILEPL